MGVDLREPLKPMVPADDQEMALPGTSEIRILVLLNELFTCATPVAMFLRLALDAGFIACHWSAPYFFLPAIGFAGLAGAGIGVGALTANRQAAAVTQATIRTQVHQRFDVHLGFTAQVAFDGQVGVDIFADLKNFGVRQVVDAAGRVDADRGDGFPRRMGGPMPWI